jgi:hypothetical protein
VKLVKPDVGEVLDRINILHLKLQKAPGAEHFQKELEELIKYLVERLGDVLPSSFGSDEGRFTSIMFVCLMLGACNGRLWELTEAPEGVTLLEALAINTERSRAIAALTEAIEGKSVPSEKV